MASTVEHQGRCLCGAVSVTARTQTNHIGACHCSTCRRWGGGPLFAVDCAGDVTIEGMDAVTIFNSSDWAERGFCRHCGTHLFYRLKQGGHHALPVGLFDDHDDWQFSEQIFIEQKPSFYSFAEETKNLTGEEVFALYSEQ